MENILEIFILILHYSRLFGLAPYTFTKTQIKSSSKWAYYSYIFIFLNILAQISNFTNYVLHSNKEEKLKLFVFACNLTSFSLNSVINSIITLKNPFFQDLELLNRIFYENRKNTKPRDIIELKLVSLVTFITCIIIAVALAGSQCSCFDNAFPFTWRDGTIRCLSLIGRIPTTIIMNGQFVMYLFAIRFVYKIMNSTIKSIKNNTLQRKGMLPDYAKYWSLIIRELMISDYKLKDLLEKVNSVFGFFNCFIIFNVFIEFNTVIVYEHIFKEKYSPCQRFVSYYWIFYSALLVCGSLAPPVLLSRMVSDSK